MASTEGNPSRSVATGGAGGTPYSVFSTQFWSEYFRTPCMKRSWLMGVGCSSVMVAHQLRLYRGAFSVGWATGSVMVTFSVTNYMHFHFCNEERRREHEFFRDALSKQGIKEWKNKDDTDTASDKNQ